MKIIKSIIFLVLLIVTSISLALTEVTEGIEWCYTINGDCANTGVVYSFENPGVKISKNIVDNIDEDFNQGVYHYGGGGILIPFILGGRGVVDNRGNYYWRLVALPSVAQNVCGEIIIPSTLGGLPVSQVGAYSFLGCQNLTDVIIGNNVNGIGDYVFAGCGNLANLSISNNVKSIGRSAFYGCNGLVRVHISNLSSWCNISFNNDLANPLFYAHNLYLNDSLIVDLEIPADVSRIGAFAFVGCSNLIRVTIPDNIKVICDSAFSGCSGLTSVHISDLSTWCNISFNNDLANPLFYAHNLYLNDSLIVDLEIPTDVSRIGDFTFACCSNLASVVIPDNIKVIGESTFMDCNNLISVTMSNDVTIIGDSAFSGCSNLTNLKISDNVTSIGDSAFRGCVGLTSVMIPSNVITIGESVFSACSNLTSVAISDNVTAISYSAFSDCCNLTDLTIPDSVTSIGAFAFSGCSKLMSLTIPSSVTSIGGNAFHDCNGLTNILVNAGSTTYKSVNGLLLSKDGTVLIRGVNGNVTIPHSVTRIQSYAFSGCSRLTSLTIPNSVKTIEDAAFIGCTGLTSVTIPDSVTSIGDSSFYGCNGLTSVQIPNNVIRIGSSAFDGCRSLTSVTIPQCICSSGLALSFPDVYQSITNIVISDGVTGIGTYAFENCKNLNAVTIPYSVTNIANNAFRNCSAVANVTVSASNTKYKFENGMLLSKDGNDLILLLIQNGNSEVLIPDSVVSIGPSAFAYCDGIMNVTIPDSVTNIGVSAFYDCGGLTSMAIPSSVTHIGLGAFNNCNMLTNFTVSGENPVYISQNGLLLSHDGKTIVCGVNGNVIIPDIVTDIGDSSFSGCSELTSIKIPNSVTNIGTWAFANCTGLTTVEIPDSVIGLGWNGSYRFYTAFYGCNCLRQVTVPQYVCQRKLSSFLPSACNNIENVIISDDVTYISSEAFSGCDNLVSIYIPNSVTNIKASTFSACRELKNATLPQDVLSRKVSSVFGSCYQTLTNIVVQDGVTNIGNQAFSGCNKLKSVMIPESVRSIGDFSFSGCGELARLQFKGDAPKLGSYVLQNVPADCCAYVRHLSSGWGSAIPGKWNGIDIDYLDSIVVFDANGGVGGVTNMLERGASIVAPTVTRTGYTFTGWSPNVAAMVPASNVTYTAQWEINRYIVTFDANGGVGGTNMVFEHGMPLVTPEVTRTNYDFRCWCHRGTVWRDGMSVTSDMTLYAQWTLQPNVWLYDVEDGKARITRYSTPTGDIIVPAEIDGYPVTAIAASVFSYRTGLTSVTIPDGVTSIDDESFRNCSALTNVWIGSGVMNIGTNAFRDCYALLNVEIGGGVTVIGNSAFRGCSRLSDITIPAGVNTIENYAFAECNSLEDVVIPDSVGFIGPSAFSSCGGLTNVTIGTGVTRIGSYAFRYCSRLVTVVFEGKCPSNMGSSVFGGVSSECCAYIHRASRGWGTVIPRSWNGITLDYIQHDVFFVANGGTCNVSSVSVADGLPIGILPTPVLTNAVFLGWFTSADGGSQMDEAMIVTQSTTLYAHWLPQTLDEAMDVDVSVRLATSEVNPWMPVFDSTAKVGDTTARSGAIGDKTNTWITATVSGAGTMSFWLKTSCEYDDEENALAADRLMIYTNGVEIVEWRMDGETDWTRREVSFAGGENTVKWVYYKDKSGVGGEDCAWVDGVMWTLTDPIPPIVSDSEVLTALAGTTDVNLTANVTNAAQYTAYRAWALSVTNDTTTAQMVKESTRTWLSYAFAADALIDKELTSDDVKIESFTPASTDGKFEFTVSVKDVNIGGGSVAVETLKENLKKVLGIEGSATLSPGGFSSDNIDITFDTPVDGKARFIVSPPADAGNSFFMRVKVK